MISLLRNLGVIVIFCGIMAYDDLENMFQSLNHKNTQLNLYLDLIRYNTQEKIGILPYILQKPDGVYLEIGTGGDPIVQMLDEIPPDAQTILIASDIEESILNMLPVRHPQLEKYINAESGPQLKLQKLNAIDMHILPDLYLDGINASSIVHEIVSYAGGLHAFRQFFNEAFRILKQGGVLVYRDPEYVKDCQSKVTVVLKNRSIRLFAHIFLYKFLDKRGSRLACINRKCTFYDPEEVTFRVYKKNEPQQTTLCFDQYLSVPSYDIDFSRKFMITMPRGLYRELARHYLTYLHQCNPLAFVKCAVDVSSGDYILHYLAHSTSALLKDFFGIDGENWNDTINIAQKQLLDKEIDQNCHVLEFGVPIYFKTKSKEGSLRYLLKQYGFEPSNYIIALSNGNCLLDYRVFGMLYDEIVEQIFDQYNTLVNKRDENQAQWLKREGEENYFYYCADDLISNVLEITLTKMQDSDGEWRWYVLCPISEQHNKYIDRLCYTEFLKDVLEVYDNLKYPIDVKDGKRIIHFKKMPLMQAIPIYKNILDKNPCDYPQLQITMDRIYNNYLA